MQTKLVTLSGNWKITKDPQNIGTQELWYTHLPQTALWDIVVPEHIPTSQWIMHLSYANVFPKYHGYVWYYKQIDVCPIPEAGERLLLEFASAGYLCEVYVNGKRVGEHRGHEKRFYFDITDAVDIRGENLLAVRCFEPRATGARLDGIKLQELPNACWGNVQAHMAGSEDAFCLECVGGILGAVHLRAVPSVRTEDIYVRSFPETGEVHVTVTVCNAENAAVKKDVSVTLSDKKTGKMIAAISNRHLLPVGSSEVCLCGRIENHKLWDLDTPMLYRATAEVDGKDPRSTTFGFKDFRIVNGYYFLNGRRIFLKGAHTCVSSSSAITMKALGFNMIRTISRAFSEETLDICDEIGLLVIDAAATGWGMTNHADARAQIESYNVNLIKRHRNHPCIAAYCLLNELSVNEIPGNDVLFGHYVASLPKLRAEAPDTLFLLHSGRWDRDITLGSASNPGSDKWDTYFGAEGIPDYPNRKLPYAFDGYQDPAMGDIHIYMKVPVMPEVRDYLRQIGSDVNPIFVSESGIASFLDSMSAYLECCDQNLQVAITTAQGKKNWDESEKFLDDFSLRDVYPLSWDLCRDTEKFNGIQRTLLYNIYRANPKINGFSFTSFGASNEGTLQSHLVIKDSLAYAIQQGHAPLRWSLFTSDRTVYADKPFTIEAVLCNEDVLKPGSYAAQAYIKGKNGCVWKKDFVIAYPETGYGGMPPLAVSVLKETISLPAGDYTFCARLTEGGIAYDGDWKFTAAQTDRVVDTTIAVCGVSDPVKTFLMRHGVQVTELTHCSNLPKMVLVGTPDTSEDEALLCTLAEQGSNVVCLDAAYFAAHPNLLQKIAGNDANVCRATGSIYHFDHVSISHPVFDGIKDAGVLDFDQFGKVFPTQIFHSVRKPDKSICAAIYGIGSFTITGLSFGEYRFGVGRFVLNSFLLNEAVGSHPYADKMLMNIVAAYGA